MLATRLRLPSRFHHVGLKPSVLRHRTFAPTSPHSTKACTDATSFDKFLEKMYTGNAEFRETMSRDNPNLLSSLAKGQNPPFMMLDCADSRVDEQVIFNAPLGTFFTTSNIANLFVPEDATTASVLAFAVDTVKVKHVVVMGHYGCAGVASAMSLAPSPPIDPGDAAIQTWISPVRSLFATSKRPEIAAYRRQLSQYPNSPAMTDIHHPAFRALVEENVKESVNRIARSSYMQKHYSTTPLSKNVTPPSGEPENDVTSNPQAVFTHGWVYDMSDGVVYDLDISVGPPGVAVPKSPFPKVGEAPRLRSICSTA